MARKNDSQNTTDKALDRAAADKTSAAAKASINKQPQDRPIGGDGNNLANPALNPVPGSAELTLAGLHFADANRGLIPGTNPRTISNTLSTQPDGVVVEDQTGVSAWTYVFGQFVDHDLDLQTTSGGADISIAVPAGDPDLPDGTIIQLNRALADPTTGTTVNTLAGYLDLSQLYGSDVDTAASLRNADGTMKTSDGNALPVGPDGFFLSGDVRVNENPELASVTTLFMREHNRLVGELAAQHKNWSGDRLYAEARALNIAEYQRITITQWLPTLINPAALGGYGGYNPAASAQVSQEFAAGAFRVGHSQISNEQSGEDNSGIQTFTQSLANALGDTAAETKANGINELLRHLSSDDAQAVDTLAVNGLRNLLIDPPAAIDLIAIDIQRERDVGLGTLNQTRTAIGLTPYASFAELTSDPALQAKLAQVYPTINDVDLFMGGLAENHAADSNTGSTFQAILADQFSRLRTGDRFWFEAQFKGKELATINSTTLGDIISRNTATPIIQDNPFVSAQRHPSDVAAEDPEAPQVVIGINQAGAVIAGGPADDVIAAGNADGQTLTGGDGADDFAFMFDGHAYTITDFVPGVDTLRFLFAGKDKVSSDAAGNAVVTHGGDAVTLAGVAAKDLKQTAFDDGAAAKAHAVFGGVLG